jgi:hypothetical protein
VVTASSRDHRPSLTQPDQLSKSNPVDEQDVNNIKGWKAPIGRDLLNQLSNLEGQLDRKVIQCPGPPISLTAATICRRATSPASAL